MADYSRSAAVSLPLRWGGEGASRRQPVRIAVGLVSEISPAIGEALSRRGSLADFLLDGWRADGPPAHARGGERWM